MGHDRRGPPAPEPETDLDRAGYKELGREGVRLARLALEEARLANVRTSELIAAVKETNRLIDERLPPPKKEEPDAVG